MTSIQGRIRESADGLRSRRLESDQLREAVKGAGSGAERRRLEAELAARGEAPPVDPVIGRTTSHGW